MNVVARLSSRAHQLQFLKIAPMLLWVVLAACGSTTPTPAPAAGTGDAASAGDGGADGGQDAAADVAADVSAADATSDSVAADTADALADQAGTGDAAADGSDGASKDGGDADAKAEVDAADSTDAKDSKDSTDSSGGPGSCVGYCGGKSGDGMCYCDDYCVQAGDCCSDFEAVCGCQTDAECQAGVGKCGTATCQSGVCETTAKKCDDNNDCTSDKCDPATGNCVATAQADGASCDGSVPCKEGSCTAGVCKTGGNSPDGDFCDDGDPCSDDDECTNGVCKGLTPTDCDDSDSCTADSCVPVQGCVSKPVTNGAACDDGDSCTGNDACQAGNCDGKPLAEGSPCNDEDSCTANDVCKGGNCDGTSVAPGSACDDEDPCTINDICEFGFCSGDYNDCEDGDPCSDDECESASGQCKNVPLKDGAKCDDDNDCTSSTVCTGGACKGTADPDGTSCDDNNDCTDQEKCAQGQCVGQPDPTADGTSCNDGNGCTGNEGCASGVCSGAPDAAVCDDGDPCTLDSCADQFGNAKCSHTAVGAGTTCDDGDPCTLGETCQAGKCAGGSGKCTAQWSSAIDCGSEANWTFSPLSAGQVGWAIDGSPNPPAPHSGACSLNFNNGKDFSDGKQVKGDATLKAQLLPAGGNYVLSLWTWHDVESTKSYDKRRVQVSADGFAGPLLVDLQLDNEAASKQWQEVKIPLPGAAGKSVQVRFAFDSVDSMSNSGAGWFVDDVALLKAAK